MFFLLYFWRIIAALTQLHTLKQNKITKRAQKIKTLHVTWCLHSGSTNSTERALKSKVSLPHSSYSANSGLSYITLTVHTVAQFWWITSNNYEAIFHSMPEESGSIFKKEEINIGRILAFLFENRCNWTVSSCNNLADDAVESFFAKISWIGP